MTLCHIAATAGFLGVIVLSAWAIARSFREEWRHVLVALDFPPAPTLVPRVEATPAPPPVPPVGGGALGEAR
jgi:hypothetical protein